MQIRKIEMQYNRGDFVNLIFLIKNIVIGLKSLEFYKQYINEKLMEEILIDTNKLEASVDRLFGLFNFNPDDIILSDQDYCWLMSLFDIEIKYKSLVSKIWENELSNIDSLDNQKDYKLLIHFLRDEETLYYIKKYFENPMSPAFVSTSLITPQLQNNIFGRASHYGIVCSLNSFNFLGANNDDGGARQSNQHTYTTLMQKGKININSSRHVLYSQYYQITMTKTPNNLIHSVDVLNRRFNAKYNEVALSKENFSPLAIAYFSDEISTNYLENKNALTLADYFNVPIIYIKEANIDNVKRL